MKLFDLSEGTTYLVAKEFTDFEGRVVPQGQYLTFRSQSYDVTTGDYLLVFRERKICLREEAGRQLLVQQEKHFIEVHGSAVTNAVEGDGAGNGLRCPNCRNPMTTRPVLLYYQPHPVEIDACRTCNLLWFDNSECVSMTARSVLDLFNYLSKGGMKPSMPLSHDPSCSRCSAPLEMTEDMQRGTRFSYWRCPHRHGELYTFTQFLLHKNFVRSPPPEDLGKLRKLVRQISCSQCGAPVDLIKDTACPHCSTAVTLLDPDGIVKAVQELEASAAKREERAGAARATEDQLRAALAAMQKESLRRKVAERNAPTDLLSVVVSAIATYLVS